MYQLSSAFWLSQPIIWLPLLVTCNCEPYAQPGSTSKSSYKFIWYVMATIHCALAKRSLLQMLESHTVPGLRMHICRNSAFDMMLVSALHLT